MVIGPMRDDFTQRIKTKLAQRVGVQCSSPACRKPTSGPHVEPNEAVNIGVAAHISAAAPGGPRYDESLTPEERRSIENGVWLCQNCAKLVDSDPDRYTAAVLRSWKADAERTADAEVKRSRSDVPLSTGTDEAPAPCPR